MDRRPVVIERCHVLALALAAAVGWTLTPIGAGALLAEALPWPEPLDRAIASLDAGDLAEAGELAALAVTEAETFGPRDPRLAQALLVQSRVERRANRAEPAVAAGRRALEIYRSAYGGESLEVGAAELELGITLGALVPDDPAEAEALLEDALRLHEAAGQDGAAGRERSLRELALLASARGDHAAAETRFRRSLALAVSRYAPDSPEMAQVLRDQARILIAQGSLDEAEPNLRRALGILEAARGTEHPVLLPVLDDLAEVHWRQKELELALGYVERALDLRRAAPEIHAVGTAANHHLMAKIHAQAGRADEAEAAFDRALSATRLAYGEGHPALLPVLDDYGDFLWASGKKAKSLKIRAQKQWVRVRARGE